MQKMKLQMIGLSVNDLLSREQLKKVMGGSGGGSGGSGAGTCYVEAVCTKDASGNPITKVSCSGTGGKCTKYDDGVQCNDDPPKCC